LPRKFPSTHGRWPRPGAATRELLAVRTFHDPGLVDLGDYVAGICGQLAGMTAGAKLPMLAYLLTMAQMEAERIGRGEVAAE
jgi:hypothetical protein